RSLARRAPVLAPLLADRVGLLLQVLTVARLGQLEELLLLVGVELEARRPRVVEARAARVVERSLPRARRDRPRDRCELVNHLVELVIVALGLLDVRVEG